MSDHGLKAARDLAQLGSTAASDLAAELRNAVTPASLAADQLGDDVAPGLGELGGDVRDSVDHILRIASALQEAS